MTDGGEEMTNDLGDEPGKTTDFTERNGKNDSVLLTSRILFFDDLFSK